MECGGRGSIERNERACVCEGGRGTNGYSEITIVFLHVGALCIRTQEKGVKEEKMSAHRQSPVNHGEKLFLQHIEFTDTDTTDFSVMIVGTKGVTERFAGYDDRSDDETVACE